MLVGAVGAPCRASEREGPVDDERASKLGALCGVPLAWLALRLPTAAGWATLPATHSPPHLPAILRDRAAAGELLLGQRGGGGGRPPSLLALSAINYVRPSWRLALGSGRAS